MSEEVLIPKMKRIDKRKRRVKIPFVTILAVILGILLIIGSTFINLEIKHFIIPSNIFSGKHLSLDDFVYTFFLIPQIPIVMFICAFLGKKLTFLSVLTYIIIGLFITPVFALGGGIKYIAQFGFGYILAYLPAVIFTGKILEKPFSFLNTIKAALAGVLTIHLCGILYMILVALIKHSGGSFISGWIEAQSGLKIVYDCVISFVLILIGQYANHGLKFIMK